MTVEPYMLQQPSMHTLGFNALPHSIEPLNGSSAPISLMGAVGDCQLEPVALVSPLPHGIEPLHHEGIPHGIEPLHHEGIPHGIKPLHHEGLPPNQSYIKQKSSTLVTRAWEGI